MRSWPSWRIQSWLISELRITADSACIYRRSELVRDLPSQVSPQNPQALRVISATKMVHVLFTRLYT